MPSPPPFSFVWLASQSPRRSELLARIGVKTKLLVHDDQADIAEDVEALERPLPGEDPAKYVERVVQAKLKAAQERHQRRQLALAPILVADTTVAIGGTILGKPTDSQHARQMLKMLSGRSHRVLTAVALARPRSPSTPPCDRSVWQPRVLRALSVSRVRFARLSEITLANYVASAEPMDKAGAYGLQGAAGAFVRRIDGSDSAIIGLPLYETARLLDQAGVARH